MSPPSPSGTNTAGSGLLLVPPSAHPTWPRSRQDEFWVPIPMSQNTWPRLYVQAGPACTFQTVQRRVQPQGWRVQRHVPKSSPCAELRVACSSLPVCHSVLWMYHDLVASPCQYAWVISSLVARTCTCPLAVYMHKRFLKTVALKLDSRIKAQERV